MIETTSASVEVTQELLPCPFCGGEDITSSYITGMASEWKVWCGKCHCYRCEPFSAGQESRNKAKAKAAEAWNTRLASSTPTPSRELARATAAIEAIMDGDEGFGAEDLARAALSTATPPEPQPASNDAVREALDLADNFLGMLDAHSENMREYLEADDQAVVDAWKADLAYLRERHSSPSPASNYAVREPFGYWVEQRHAEPVLLRKPAYIPEPNDNRSVTPLYASPSPASVDEGLVEAVRGAMRNAEFKRGEVVLHASDWLKITDALSRRSPVAEQGEGE
jgi:hypothetical protein